MYRDQKELGYLLGIDDEDWVLEKLAITVLQLQIDFCSERTVRRI